MKIYIHKKDSRFEVGLLNAPGAPRVGRGKSMKRALGDFLIAYSQQLGITEIEMDDESRRAEQARREKELSKR